MYSSRSSFCQTVKELTALQCLLRLQVTSMCSVFNYTRQLWCLPSFHSHRRSCVKVLSWHARIDWFGSWSRFSSAVSYFSLNTAAHQLWSWSGKSCYKSTSHLLPAVNTLTLLPPLLQKHGRKNAQVHLNKHTYAHKWLVSSTRPAIVMHSLVRILRLHLSQLNIQTDFGQMNSHSLKHQTN